MIRLRKYKKTWINGRRRTSNWTSSGPTAPKELWTSFLPETKLVGMSAHGFTADWSLPNVRRIPSGADLRAYIDDYEHARVHPFSARERQSVFATCVYWIAYGARCQHSLEPDKTEWEENTFPFLLLTEGEALLAWAIEG